MTQDRDPQTDVWVDPTDIARWHNEGGAFKGVARRVIELHPAAVGSIVDEDQSLPGDETHTSS